MDLPRVHKSDLEWLYIVFLVGGQKFLSSELSGMQHKCCWADEESGNMCRWEGMSGDRDWQEHLRASSGLLIWGVRGEYLTNLDNKRTSGHFHASSHHIRGLFSNI